MLKISARDRPRMARTQSFKIAGLLRCHAPIVMKMISEYDATLLKLPVKS